MSSPLQHSHPVWQSIRHEAEALIVAEPMLADYVRSMILDHSNFEQAMGQMLAQRLASLVLPGEHIQPLALRAVKEEPAIRDAAQQDLMAIRDRDPACRRYSEPFLYYKGYQGLQAYRVAHWLWQQGRRELAIYLQSRISDIFSMDIHPAARIGSGILIDHAHSIVIGETAVVGDNVSMLHEVTLGGTGKDGGDRHPKIASGVLIGAGAKILGNVTVGQGAKIGAGSVVLDDVSPHSTVAGVPARPVGSCPTAQPALEMDHTLTHDQQDVSPSNAHE